MQVAFFLDTFPTLSETFIRNQITGLIDLGHEVTIFCHPNPDKKAWEIEDVKNYQLQNYIVDRKVSIPKSKGERIRQGLKLIQKYWPTNKRQLCESLNFLKHGKKAIDLTLLHSIAPFLGQPFEVMQCHFGHVANQAVILKEMKFNFRMQVMFHGFDIRLGIEQGGSIYDGLIKHADKIQAISNYNYKHLIEFGFAKDKVEFHPVGIDMNKFPQKKEYNTNATIQILSVGRLVWEKGYKYGIEAISKLIKEYDFSITYTIIGAGELFQELQNLTQELGIKEQVVFAGAKEQKEISLQMQQSDIFFLPSEAEALPVVLMEAMACGLPTVATNVGSVTELVQDGKSGFITNPKDYQDMTLKLKALIEKKKEWEEMGNFGWDYITKKYNIQYLNKRLIS